MKAESVDKVKALFLIFRKAIDGERAAQKMYKQALDLADDPELRTLLAQFVEEEGRHEEVLLAHYARMRTQLGADEYPESAPPAWKKVKP